MATVAIGDIHGNLSALEELLAKIMPTMGQDDVLVFLGDYIDRGPDTRGCLERLVRLRGSQGEPVDQCSCRVLSAGLRGSEPGRAIQRPYLIKHARYHWLFLAESHLTRRLFLSMIRRIASQPLPAG